MTIQFQPLVTTSFENIIDCFVEAFSDYFVTMPTDPEIYRQRWHMSGVDWDLSVGAFDREKLVGFIIHSVGDRQGFLTAHNSGTGVIPTHRGKGLVYGMYDYAFPRLIDAGIQKSRLEVITENIRAVRAYQKVGFQIAKTYK